ncbi:hypothetical protein SEA_SCHMIDT_63 [Gordonia phage Schmidt]|uniref:UBE2O-like SH3-B domain-containing protein n=1 Tax=Gordonia phage Schmidt TaxID=2301697 RepID=A0A385E088_9CAUD|nr:hypothetical protein KDJ59_gp63 [Gordonia phage Schmidt]AXQ65183.1 hypothetical protein SEA_SCHMIDT_63 [Gordonia phage Schmidt]
MRTWTGQFLMEGHCVAREQRLGIVKGLDRHKRTARVHWLYMLHDGKARQMKHVHSTVAADRLTHVQIAGLNPSLHSLLMQHAIQYSLPVDPWDTPGQGDDKPF